MSCSDPTESAGFLLFFIRDDTIFKNVPVAHSESALRCYLTQTRGTAACYDCDSLNIVKTQTPQPQQLRREKVSGDAIA